MAQGAGGGGRPADGSKESQGHTVASVETTPRGQTIGGGSGGGGSSSERKLTSVGKVRRGGWWS